MNKVCLEPVGSLDTIHFELDYSHRPNSNRGISFSILKLLFLHFYRFLNVGRYFSIMFFRDDVLPSIETYCSPDSTG